MYGIGKTNMSRIADWRLMFIACGVISLVGGILFYILVPVSPKAAWFLSEREKEIALKRLFEESERAEFNKFCE